MDSVLERTTAVLTVAYFDENGAATTPTSAYYMVEDVKSGTLITSETQLPAPSTTSDITLTDTENRIIDADNAYELRAVKVRFLYAAGKVGRAEYKYYIKNLAKVA